jgi:ABC-type nitrate/sulfonate/bicarbonate transport system substrate-binding protein
MPSTLRHTLLSLRDLAATAGPFVLLAALLLALAYLVLQPNPPRRVVLATGVDQGAYAEFGRRYAQRLEAHGITVELRATEGAAENLALLRDAGSGVDLGFVQGGSDDGSARDDGEGAAGLVSLGSMFHEPVWLFYREDAARRRLGAAEVSAVSQLAGWRLNIGAPGSGVAPLMRRLLKANQVESAHVELLRQATTPAVVDFLEGRLDALVLVSAPEAHMVQMLLRTPGVRLFDFVHAQAYARRFPFVTPVALPRGVVDLANDRPPRDVHLVAPTAALVARESLHPALVQLFVQTSREVHGEAGWFQRRGEFPNLLHAEYPFAPEAERIHRNGVPWLQRYLPFWLANLADRMWVAVLAIAAVLLPLSRIVPPLYEFRVRSRVFRWYGELRAVEQAAGTRPAGELLRELDAIEQRVQGVSVPLSYADELYALRSHIQWVRRKLLGEPV